jgi:1-acyl-sn-glycerol-3-phosphate acyltransferase
MNSLFTKTIKFATARVVEFMWLGKISGTKNIPTSPCVIIANHESYLDFLLIGYSLAKIACIPFNFWAKTKVINHWWWKKYSEIFSAIEVKQTHGLESLIEQSREALKQGNYICIFPEGTRSRTGELLSFKCGYLKLASSMGLEIVPVYLENTFQAWPPFKRLPRRIKCNVTFYPPIKISQDIKKADMEELNRSIMRWYGDCKSC